MKIHNYDSIPLRVCITCLTFFKFNETKFSFFKMTLNSR